MPSHCPLCPHGYLYDASGCSVEPHGEQFFDQWIQCDQCDWCWGSWSEVDAEYPPQAEEDYTDFNSPL